ncbi:MAG: hypothetical protein E7262_09750 [Lachnospiraceae bacterium]|nr:hypothetical protein [Lachnospiraceae bacterium]
MSSNQLKGTPIFIIDSLIVEIYTIGYRNEGESIVILIKVDNNVKYSGVIDCYEIRGKGKYINKTIDILQKNNVEYLNFICWSHPDTDHSKGLDKIVNSYSGSNTRIWLPEGVFDYDPPKRKGLAKIYNTMNEQVKKERVYTADTGKDMMLFEDIVFRKGTEDYLLQMKVYTPPSNIIRKKMNQKFRPNDYSISFLMSLGQTGFLFTGDMTGEIIDNVYSKFSPLILNYLKLPHHGTDKSKELLKYVTYSEKVCTTLYKGQDLPKETVLKEYKGICENLYVTNSKEELEKEKFGIIKLEYDLINKKCSRHFCKGAFEYE